MLASFFLILGSVSEDGILWVPLFLGVAALSAILFTTFFWDGWFQRTKKSTEPIIGWRFWNVGSRGTFDGETGRYQDEFALYGVMGETWKTPHKSAECKLVVPAHPSKQAPVWGCVCGIYAMKGERFLEELSYALGLRIYGRVALSGVVIEHEKGYRAQNAEIVELILILDDGGLANSLWIDALRSRKVAMEKAAERLGVPVTKYTYSEFVNMMEVMYGHR